jgi:CheY-like chemotaxis protein
MANSSQPFRVLVVDNERTIADTLRTILTLSGYDAFAAYSAEQALDLCHENRPDAVIADVVMGPMNGIELAIHLAETVPECKVLLLSGNVMTESLLLDSRAGTFNLSVVTKPAHPKEILQFLADIQTDPHPSV